MTALLCVGETSQEKEYGVTEEAIRKQLKIALKGATECQNLWIAYEPVWAIGEGGLPAEPGYVAWVLRIIRNTLQELFGSPASTVPLLYGGSVNPSNCRSLATLDDINGLFIGRSAWDILQLEDILNRIHSVIL